MAGALTTESALGAPLDERASGAKPHSARRRQNEDQRLRALGWTRVQERDHRTRWARGSILSTGTSRPRSGLPLPCGEVRPQSGAWAAEPHARPTLKHGRVDVVSANVRPSSPLARGRLVGQWAVPSPSPFPASVAADSSRGATLPRADRAPEHEAAHRLADYADDGPDADDNEAAAVCVAMPARGGPAGGGRAARGDGPIALAVFGPDDTFAHARLS